MEFFTATGEPSLFFCGLEKFHLGRSFSFLIINVCNHGEHYEMPCISYSQVGTTEICCAQFLNPEPVMLLRPVDMLD